VLANASTHSRTLPVSFLQVSGDCRELLKRSFRILHDLKPVPFCSPRHAHAARASQRVITLCPKQLQWKLLAQFSLSRERDVANIIA